jgi:hypothetical protein
VTPSFSSGRVADFDLPFVDAPWSNSRCTR